MPRFRTTLFLYSHHVQDSWFDPSLSDRSLPHSLSFTLSLSAPPSHLLFREGGGGILNPSLFSSCLFPNLLYLLFFSNTLILLLQFFFIWWLLSSRSRSGDPGKACWLSPPYTYTQWSPDCCPGNNRCSLTNSIFSKDRKEQDWSSASWMTFFVVWGECSSLLLCESQCETQHIQGFELFHILPCYNHILQCIWRILCIRPPQRWV